MFTKQTLKDTLIQLSKLQMASTSATPQSVATASVAREHQSKQFSFNESGVSVRKEDFYKFNHSDDFT